MRYAITLVAAGLVACASASAPIRMLGPQGSVQALAGNWSGSYSGFETRRTGTISFSLKAGDTIAFGDVLMIPRGYEHHDVWTERHRHTMAPPQHPAVLTITFVVVSDGQVAGVLEPYTDPDCSCQVVTTFAGRLTRSDVLEGIFATRIPGTTATNRGEWKVTRRSP